MRGWIILINEGSLPLHSPCNEIISGKNFNYLFPILWEPPQEPQWVIRCACNRESRFLLGIQTERVVDDQERHPVYQASLGGSGGSVSRCSVVGAGCRQNSSQKLLTGLSIHTGEEQLFHWQEGRKDHIRNNLNLLILFLS